MTTHTHPGSASAATPHDDTPASVAPGRPRRRLITGRTVTLAAIVTAAAGFIGGVQVEKSHGASSGTSAPSGSRRGAATGSAPSGAPSTAFPDSASAGTTGTVTAVKGNTVTVKTSTGTVTVKLSSATTVTKHQTVGRGQLNPGDSVSVTGQTQKSGTISATAVSDSGDDSTASSATSTSSASSASGASSATGGASSAAPSLGGGAPAGAPGIG